VNTPVVCILQIHWEAEHDLPGEITECKDTLGIYDLIFVIFVV